MNKEITEGLVLRPTPYADGLDVYSSGDGTPGSDTYDGASNAAFVPSDQDFGGAIELLKTQSTQRLRYMAQTPILPGCYLRVTARVKAVSGNLPLVRIAGYPALGNGNVVPGVTTVGPSVALTTYGEVVEISAIIGSGLRGGVDMVWGPDAVYGHLGLDLTGQNGGIIRIDDLVIEDITSVFLLDRLAQVDVRDYGALGNGVTDDTAAFEAANAAADGQTVLIPTGTYRLNGDVTFDAPTRFEGTVSMPAGATLLLRQNFDLPAYIDAFDNEETAFLKAFQALLSNADHDSLDMGGRKVTVTRPLDMQSAVPNRTSFATRRVIRNGQLEAANSAAWNSVTVTSQATYNPSSSRTLSGVSNVANIPVGSLVSGAGVGREVYVRSKNVATQEITLNAGLFDAAGTQNFTFTEFKYLVDFSGFASLSKFVMSDIEFQCNDRCSGIKLAPSGTIFNLRDCFISRPKDRGITSIGGGCQGMLIDRCQFLSAEDSLNVSNRSSIGLNTNANDVKLRDNRATRFRHFAFLGGDNSIVSGNHFFQGDSVADGVRSAGLIIAASYASTTITSNYIDNCFIEWTNEHDQEPAFTGGFSFSSLGIADNIFLSGDVAPWFSYIVVKPHGAGHFLNGVNITGNRFRTIQGAIDRVERVDDSFSPLDLSRSKNVVMTGNSYHLITEQVSNMREIEVSQNTAASTWVVDLEGKLPFNGQALNVDSVIAHAALRESSGSIAYETPYVDLAQGGDRDQIHLKWRVPVRGRVSVAVRMDNR